MNDSSEPRTTLLGATVTPGAAARDALLAGGFTMLTVWVAYGTALAGVIGLAGGGFLGATLHLVPAVARKGDSALGRILIRTGTGAIAGAGVAGFPRWLLPLTGEPAGSVAQGVALGAAVGCGWYLVWGLAETRLSDRHS